MSAVLPVSNSKTAYGFSTPGGAATMSTGAELVECFFACAFTGTYVQGTGFSLSLANDIAATIANTRRDSKSYTIVSLTAESPGREGTTNAWVMPGAITLGGGNATGLLYGSDLATEHAAAAMLAFNSPCVFRVVFEAL